MGQHINLDRQRLAALLGMLGSDYAGERDNAARAAQKLARGAGLTWGEILAAPEPPTWTQPPEPPTWTPPPQATLREAVERVRGFLSMSAIIVGPLAAMIGLSYLVR